MHVLRVTVLAARESDPSAGSQSTLGRAMSGDAFCACQKSEDIWCVCTRGLHAAERVQADTASLGEDQFLFAVPWPQVLASVIDLPTEGSVS